jgi:putative acetyltransferase
VQVSLESPAQADVLQLVEELDAFQKPLYPAESHHGIDLAALSQSNVLFAVARDTSGRAIACGAVVLEREYGELKRMYTKPEFRGQGVGKSLLAFLEAKAKERGVVSFALETGYLQPEAIALYSRCGYVRCGPFGQYTEDPNSVFMVKSAA